MIVVRRILPTITDVSLQNLLTPETIAIGAQVRENLREANDIAAQGKDALARIKDGDRPRGPRRGARQFTAGPADTVDDALPVRPAPDAWLRRCRVKDETAPGASEEPGTDGGL